MKRKPKQQSVNERYSHISLNIMATAFFIAIAAVLPVYMPRLGYLFLTKQKTDLFITFTAIASAATVLILFFTTSRFRVENYFAENEPKRRLSISEWALIAFLLLTFLSAVFSPGQDFVWHGFTTNGVNGRWEGFWAFLCYGLTFFIIARFYKPKRWHFLIFAGSSALVSLYGILQFMGTDVLLSVGFYEIPEAMTLGSTSRLFRTTLGNNNVVSGYCSLVIVLFSGLFAGEESKWGVVYLAASAMAFAMLCITSGDAGRVGVLVSMVLIIPYWISDRKRLGKLLVTLASWITAYASVEAYKADKVRRYVPEYPPEAVAALGAVLLALGLCLILFIKKWPNSRSMKIAGAALLAASIIGGLLFVEIEGSRRSDRPRDIIWQAREMMHGRMEDRFGSGRGHIWRMGMSVVFDNPLLGTGPDTFFFALGGRQVIPAEPTPEDPFPSWVTAQGMQLEAVEKYKVIYDKAHNAFLQIAVCMGIPALLAYLIFLGGLFLPSVKRAFNRPVLFAFGAAALSYIIQTFFQIDTPIDRPLAWLALGVMAGELWRERVGART